MKYLKLFEDQHSELYTEITAEEYNTAWEIHNLTIKSNREKILNILKDNGFDPTKTGSIRGQIYYNFYTSFRSKLQQNPNNWMNVTTKADSAEQSAFVWYYMDIFEIPDEYFIVWLNGSKIRYSNNMEEYNVYYRCDQIDGLASCIKMISNRAFNKS